MHTFFVQGLFHQVIAMSGSALVPWGFDDVNQEADARAIAAKVGCTQQDLNSLVDCMRTVDYAAITNADAEYAVSNDDNIQYSADNTEWPNGYYALFTLKWPSIVAPTVVPRS